MGEKGIGKDQRIHWVLLSLTLHTIYLNIKKYIWNFLDWLLTNQIDCVIEWKFEKPMFSRVTDVWSNGNVNSNCHFPRISLVLCIYHFILSHLISDHKKRCEMKMKKCLINSWNVREKSSKWSVATVECEFIDVERVAFQGKHTSSDYRWSQMKYHSTWIIGENSKENACADITRQWRRGL